MSMKNLTISDYINYLKRIELIHLLWDFDAVSLYPSAMWDPKSIYPKIETGFAFGKHMITNSLKNLIIKLILKDLLF